ncbi:hypothetical protein A0H81_04840 [Grifola frondosa]|uniref:Uncharacterized protein n=1 Tax=Grifola frondosa TaxID=5627 RepID=A0A1C7MG56_GRIFR|nr:hypothetical protein A0H81_04840 [Grifola frondosa]
MARDGTIHFFETRHLLALLPLHFLAHPLSGVPLLRRHVPSPSHSSQPSPTTLTLTAPLSENSPSRQLTCVRHYFVRRLTRPNSDFPAVEQQQQSLLPPRSSTFFPKWASLLYLSSVYSPPGSDTRHTDSLPLLDRCTASDHALAHVPIRNLAGRSLSTVPSSLHCTLTSSDPAAVPPRVLDFSVYTHPELSQQLRKLSHSRASSAHT